MRSCEKIKNLCIEFLKNNGAKPWHWGTDDPFHYVDGNFITPNGHRFSFDCSGDVFAIFHRVSEWGEKQNFFAWNNEKDLEKKALDFIKSKIK